MTEAAPDTLIATVGMARYLYADPNDILHVNLGDFHPGAHGGLELELGVEAGLVRSCEPRIGLMHRSAEKLFEARDYRQIMMLANRHDWVSAASSELGVALAVEAATGMVPPKRATWSRMLLVEAGRIGVASLLLGSLGAPGAMDIRELWSDWQEQATGGRVHPMINRIGGLEHALSKASVAAARDLAQAAVARADAWHAHIESRTELHGLAVLSLEAARTYACSGPVGQASGLDWDLRRDDPYLNYHLIDVDWSDPVQTTGDAAARYRALVSGISISSQVIARCVDELEDLDDEPYAITLPKTLRAPESTVYIQTQNPLGIAGWLLVSDGDALPVRLKARTPSFAHLQAMPDALIGTAIEDLGAAVASFFFVVGDADR